MQFRSINGIVIHYQLIGGSAGKPILVFINSLGTDFRIWRDVIVRLAGDFAIVAYDKRGHGLSGIGEPPYEMETHVADLAGLLDFLSVKQAVVCGLSVGGLIAQGLFANRPDLVRALVLCDTAHKIGTDEFWNGRIASVEKEGIASIADLVLERWFTPPFHRDRADELAGYRSMLVRQPTAGYAGTCAALRDADFTDVARRITVPALCVVGDQDGSTPPDLVLSLARLIPGARYEVIQGAGHIPCVEQPEALSTLIRSFADQLQ
jgi:3-oxoadipate enol-lactonase